jgi:glycosyltransferase involved in cell wall biosynthesis
MLFVSSTIGGGSGRSQRALARALTDRGHEVRFLVDDERHLPRTRFVGEKLADAAARATFLDALAGMVGTRLDRIVEEGLEMWATPFPENGFRAAIDRFEPDVVVGNSMDRYSWRRIREQCLELELATVLYIRGVASFTGLDIEPNPADTIVANAISLTEDVAARGHECLFVPSLVDTSATDVESSREVALLINPIESHGIDLLWKLASALPEIPFVIQQSWDLDRAERTKLEQRAAQHPNVTFRPRRPAGPDLYRDARVLLVPHRIDNRPRVIIETQVNGIPSLVSDFGGLREALGRGGAVLPDDTDAWIDAVRAAFEDDDTYGAWCDGARAEADRTDLDPASILDAFEAVVDAAIARCTAAPPRPDPALAGADT